MISDCIRPLPPLTSGPTKPAEATWSFLDNTVTIFPKGRNGKSMRVVIIRRVVTLRRAGSDRLTQFHVCRNAGKWSYRIDYAFKSGTTRMKRREFIKELRRMGGEQHLAALTQIA